MNESLALVLPRATPNFGVPEMLRIARSRTEGEFKVTLHLRGKNNSILFEIAEISHDSIIGQEVGTEFGRVWLDIIPFHAIDRIRISKS